MDMMDNCLFCFKEIDLQSPPHSNSNPSQVICKTLSNLFSSLNNSPELFYVKNETKLIDSQLQLCPACFKCIDRVQATFNELEALQVKLEQFRQKIQNELIGGYKKSRAVSKSNGQLQLSESFQLRKSIVQSIAPSILDDVLADYDEPNEENTTIEDFNNFHDFDDDLPILSPYSTFDDLNLNLNEIKPTSESLSFWNLKPLQIVLTRCDEENTNTNRNAVESFDNPPFKNIFQRKSAPKTKTLLSEYKCENCTIYFLTRYNYGKHMLNKHAVDINLDVKTTDDLASLESETDDDLPDDEAHMSYKTFLKYFTPDVAKCPRCKRMFKSPVKHERKRALASHLRTIHSVQIKLKKDKPSRAVSKSKYAKYYRIEKVNGVDQVKCPLCPSVFTFKGSRRGLSSALTQHIDTIHKPNRAKKITIIEPRGEFSCEKCRAKFSKRSYLEKHECFDERLTLLKSSESAQINENSTVLQLLHGQRVLDQIHCDHCGKVFEGKLCKGRLKDHLSRIHNINVRRPPKKNPIKKEKEKNPLLCNYSGCASAKIKMDFRSLGELRRHMKSHGEVLQLEHQCDRCTDSFETSISLRDHQLRVHERKHQNGPNSFICEVCAKGFDNKHSFRVHQTAMHQLKYTCQVPTCNKIYVCKTNFDYHLRSYHGIGEKLKYQCDHKNCNYSANRRAHFEMHISTHTELRAFKCKLCNVSVKTKRGLGYHVFACHTHPESAKRQCSQCELSFLCKRELDNHLIVRHGIGENIKCTYCPREFAIRRYMRNHVKKDHPNEDNTKAELMKRWVPLEMLEAPLEVQKELVTSIIASEQG